MPQDRGKRIRLYFRWGSSFLQKVAWFWGFSWVISCFILKASFLICHICFHFLSFSFHLYDCPSWFTHPRLPACVFSPCAFLLFCLHICSLCLTTVFCVLYRFVVSEVLLLPVNFCYSGFSFMLLKPLFVYLLILYPTCLSVLHLGPYWIECDRKKFLLHINKLDKTPSGPKWCHLPDITVYLRLKMFPVLFKFA